MRISKNGFAYEGVSTKICEYCDVEFEAIKPKIRFCSITCANKSRRPKYERICPICKEVITYSGPQTYCIARKRGAPCKQCTRRLVPARDDVREKNRRAQLGKKLSEETKRKISESLKKNPPSKGKRMTEEAKTKLRVKRIERLTAHHGQLMPAFNPDGCKAIDEYGKLHGYNFQHAMNGGEYHIKELGFWVDGYDPEQNVVIEYDELHHKNRVEKDLKRQQLITEYLNCKFIRIGPLHD